MLSTVSAFPQLKKAKIDNGLAYISKGEISNKIFSLNGKWEFYPDQLLEPNDFKQKKSQNNFYFVDVPEKWNYYLNSDNKNSGNGYGTYRLRIIHFEKNNNLAFALGNIFTATKVYVDGKNLIELGTVGINKYSSVSNFKPSIISFTPKSDTSEIIIQVSNFNYAKGGVIREIKIGTKDAIKDSRAKANDFDLFLIGSFLVTALYHFSLFILRRKDLSVLFFGLVCLLVTVRIAFTNEIYILNILPNLEWSTRIRIEYLTFCMAPLIFHSFVYFLYNNLLHKNIFRANQIITAAYTLIIIYLPIGFFTELLIPFQAFTVLLIIYGLYILTKAVISKEDGALIFMIGFTIFMLATINDFLYYNNTINTVKSAYFGLFLFFFLQSYLLSKRFNQSFIKTEELSEELNTLNKNLENKIRERTQEIQTQNNILEQQREKISNQHKIVLEQKEGITSSINYAKYIQQAILSPKKTFENLFNDYFIIFKPQNIVSGDFYWIGHIKNKTIVIAADCTGHGVPGGFMSMLGIAFLNEIILKHKFKKASDILEELRIKVKTSLHQTENSEIKDGMDLALLINDEKTGEVQYAGANSNLYIVTEEENKTFNSSFNEKISYGNKKLIQVTADKQPAAIYLREKAFTNHQFQLSENDKIYMFSDGYADQIGGENNMKFMIKRLRNLIIKTSYYNFKKQKEILSNTFEEWKNDNIQTDDILMLGFSLCDKKIK